MNRYFGPRNERRQYCDLCGVHLGPVRLQDNPHICVVENGEIVGVVCTVCRIGATHDEVLLKLITKHLT